MFMDNYAEYLEKKLVTEFKEKFYEKLGYEPHVFTKVKIEQNDIYLPVLSLEQLERCFDSFLPKSLGKQLTLKTRNRKRELVDLRNIYCAIARSMRYTFSQIGQYLDKRDHTTIINCVTCFNNLLSYDVGFQEKYKNILIHIKNQHDSANLEQPDQTFSEPESTLLS